METRPQMSQGRYLVYLTYGLVVSVVMVGVGIWGVGWSAEPVLGWIMLAAGIAITALSIVQLRHARIR
nr:hypothetical protein [Microbacterium lemovicicum]